IDQPVAEILPAFAGEGKEGITVRQLLTHTAGLPRGWAEGYVLHDYDGFVARAAALPLAHEIGSRIEYSNAGYCLVGAVVARTGRDDFEAVTRREVFEPLGLAEAGYTLPERLWDRTVEVYDSRTDDIPFAPNTPRGRSIPRPWGSLFATADDVAR